jgi:plasmanylethanolamine desaturase
MNAPHYARSQRLLELSAIALFVTLTGCSVLRLVSRTEWQLPLVLLCVAPCAWLVADLLSGLLHWAFDSLGSAATPLIGRAFIQPFRAHHADPAAMTQHDFIETHGASCLAALPLLAMTSVMPLNGWPALVAQAFLLCLALGALATNQCHKWAHMDAAVTPSIVVWAQHWRLVLPREHHRLHHTAPFDAYFCMSCGWCNRLLNAAVRLWR